MDNLLDEMQYILESDPTIRSFVSFEKDEMTGIEYPGIAKDVIPQGMKLPYICIRVESDVPEVDNDALNRAFINFDVFAENDRTKVNRMAKRIEQLFHNRKLMPFGIISLRDGIYPIISDDPSVTGKNVKILVRYPREDLVPTDAVAESNTVIAYAKVRHRS